jgi:hypothetical protein
MISCPMCGSKNVTLSDVYELGELAWCHTCKYSFRPPDDTDDDTDDDLPE